LDRSRDKECKR
jgi:uncharacterized protein with GYD domain